MGEEITSKRILEELAAVAFSRIGDSYGPDWTPNSTAAGAALASVEKTSSGVKLKFYDKLKALELLGKALGLFEGAAAQQESNNLLEALVLATGKEVDIDDIPEVQQAAADSHQLVESAEMEGP